MDKNIKVEPLNISFAKSMEIITWIGIIGMLTFGVLYLIGISSFVEVKDAINYWNLSTIDFWKEIKGMEISGYGWFLNNLSAMDSLSMLGICILSIAPLVAIISAIPKTSQRIYIIFFIILTIEFLFAIVRPLMIAGGGE